MKATGIVRRIDDLGRVVVPKEIRRTLRLREGEPMEIFTGKDGEIILKKYSPVGELENHARELAESIAQITGYLTCVADTDQIIAASGHGQREYQGKSISPELESLIKAKGFVDCLVALDEAGASVTVMTETGTLNGDQVARIRDAVLTKCPQLSAQQLTIVEVK